ncbi:MAG: recombinase A [Polyangiaceae bacterium]|jgi:recombination protein RecA
MDVAHDIEALRARLANATRREDMVGHAGLRVLSLGTELDAVLPDRGLPCGVVELSAPRALGGSTSVALAAIRSGQRRCPGAWCAWLDSERTLHAPGLLAAGVALERLLIVSPPRVKLGHVALTVANSGAFEVVAIDFDAVPETNGVPARLERKNKREWKPDVLVRKLALTAESNGVTVLLLTDAAKPRSVPWPVALRLELSRPSLGEIHVRVGKDKRGRVGFLKTIPFEPLLRRAG